MIISKVTYKGTSELQLSDVILVVNLEVVNKEINIYLEI